MMSFELVPIHHGVASVTPHSFFHPPICVFASSFTTSHIIPSLDTAMYKRRRKSSKGTEASLRRQSHSSPPLTPDDQLEEPLHHDSPRLRAARIETPPIPPLPPLLNLPFEIRQQIYNLCLIGKPAHPFTWPAGHSNPHIQPQLLSLIHI